MAIQQVTVKPEHIKKTGPVKKTERQSGKGEDMFSTLLSLSLNIANQQIKDTGLAEKNTENEKPAKAADKKEGSDDENKMKGSRVQVAKGSSETSMSMPLTKDNENPNPHPPVTTSGASFNPLPEGEEISLPLKGRGRVGMGSFSGEPDMNGALTKGHENQGDKNVPPILFKGRRILEIPSPLRGESQGGGELRVSSCEPLMSHEITKNNENPLLFTLLEKSGEGGVDTTTDFKLPVDILPDSIVNPQIENLDNNKLLNDNGMLVTAVKGTPVNTDGNNISSQSVYRYADQGNLVQYMSQQIIHASHVGTHTAKISLRPAELGDLRLDISVADKNVKALIVVENEEIKKMVESGFNSLRDDLKNQGLNVEQFSVEIQKDDFMDNFKSLYERNEKGSNKWENIIAGKNTGSTEHPLMMPALFGIGVKGGISIFA
ncbi:MAG: flagellar hook-length control protein FliK [Nitrospirae bacterium]|nr:flagellar hook-length control protein FliK [Nitrospirota bacterium]